MANLEELPALPPAGDDTRATCTASAARAKVVSLETSLEGQQALLLLASRRGWRSEVWQLMPTLLSSGSGEPPEALHNSMLPAAGTADAEVMSLARLSEISFPGDGIFLLRLRGESSTLDALLGTEALLSRPRMLRFLVFEYSASRWGNTRLEDAVKFMFGNGYLCFLMTEDDLFPVSGVLWDSGYATSVWSNIFCAAVDDTWLLTLLALYCPEPSRSQSVVRALRELYGHSA
ncbi:unnamed protein product [Polarella glacialis]|uniref:Uncharacterized protein n=1 Tax=Polarella glacialis TaxID=89957 RepID=A0A813J8Y9_POLGL|nr:unnamed protein product [Polarella glacialis]